MQPGLAKSFFGGSRSVDTSCHLIIVLHPHGALITRDDQINTQARTHNPSQANQEACIGAPPQTVKASRQLSMVTKRGAKLPYSIAGETEESPGRL